uniref:ammonia-forming cytochrome c nitrite reductase subunit c552 n=1 Tax=uncultured Draconibacterium sp. TaxID=1573823 RepID=UPI0032179336
MKYSSFLKLFLFAIICVFMAASCTTKEGPMGASGLNGMNGENGINGVDGKDGTDGTDGVDGNVSCLVCHTQAGMDALRALYNYSGHNAASAVSYAGSRASCSPCHSNELFLNALNNAPGVAAIDIAYPTKISCTTCHANHQSLEDDITAPMTTVEPVTAIADATVTLDFGNASNLCANCHQSRRGYEYYQAITSVKINGIETEVPDGMVAINSTHAGPHHGPQANTLLGNGGIGTGTVSTHTSVGCTGCHMGDVDGTTGGHSFIPSLTNCNKCHSGATDYNINGKRTEFDTRMTAIAEALVSAGALSKDEDTGEYHPAVSIVTDAEFEAFWNYMYLYEDHSHGAHNPAYFATLLNSAETALGL